MLHELIPISLFVCATYGFTVLVKALLDARMRTLIMRDGASEETIRVLVEAEHRQRRWSALRWGIGLCLLAAGFELIQIAGWREITPGVVAVLAGAVGLGQLAFYAISRSPQDIVPSPKENP
jgi:hypothetical protein